MIYIYIKNHLVAHIFKQLIICLDFGIVITANRKSYWARNTGNKTTEEGFDIYVYERVWKHT